MTDWDALLDAIEAGHTGDADAAVAVFAEAGRLRGNADEDWVNGESELLPHFLAYGGRREVFQIDEVLADDERAAVRFTLAFRADAHQYGQVGTAWITTDDAGKITTYDATWVEIEIDLAVWDED